ncbi:efflux RND transporter periplasmic adaptor subunit [Dinghuibacter silviterrae]|uniref:Membrane fusion protein (Multidrug efflux system) n=1 Tax=Dinghuibacter silviterrae TaxID=1539049 RepID=A0A4V3GKK0_9BACT|nr:efflux RND transporter periplasmic adaptor subunit [Dinghuibacter silviterrae]TDW95992.1 membrane fusion protein (multidrug efflux system) [Dinghuibacter silviterrae]
MTIRLQLLAATALVLSSCGSTSAPAPVAVPPVPITTDTVKEQNMTFSTVYPGKVVPLRQVDIHADVQGYVTGIFFKDGQHVRQGALLYEIDKRKYQAAYDQAVASLHTAEASLVKDQQDVDRYTRLYQQDAVAKQKLDYAVSAQKSDQAQVEAAKAAMASAGTDLKYASITAPFDGTIGISQVRLGAVVTQGSTILNTISSDDPMAVDFQLDEKQLPAFEKVLHQFGRLDSLFTLYLPDQTRYPAFGTFYTMDRAVDPQMGTITVRVTAPNKMNDLRAGLSVNVRVLNPSGGPQTVIPMIAAVEQMSEYFVFVVQDSTVRQQRVKLGSRNGALVVVLDGLKPGDVIARDGIQRLHDKSVVKLK